jgi:hypothetical protein
MARIPQSIADFLDGKRIVVAGVSRSGAIGLNMLRRKQTGLRKWADETRVNNEAAYFITTI